MVHHDCAGRCIVGPTGDIMVKHHCVSHSVRGTGTKYTLAPGTTTRNQVQMYLVPGPGTNSYQVHGTRYLVQVSGIAPGVWSHLPATRWYRYLVPRTRYLVPGYWHQVRCVIMIHQGLKNHIYHVTVAFCWVLDCLRLLWQKVSRIIYL